LNVNAVEKGLFLLFFNSATLFLHSSDGL